MTDQRLRPRGDRKDTGERQKARYVVVDGTCVPSSLTQDNKPWTVLESLSPESWAATPLPSSSQTWQRVQSVLKWLSLAKKVPGGQGRHEESPQGSVQGAFM